MSKNVYLITPGGSQWSELETLVDANGVRAVVSALITLCRDRAAHSGTTWVGESNRQDWEQCANRLEAALCHMPKDQ